MAENITFEDLNTFADALKYADTLLRTAESGVELSYDFIRSYDYYGTVRMAIPNGTPLEAPTVVLKNYDVSKFYQYTPQSMSNFFYPKSSGAIPGVVVEDASAETDMSLLTKQYIESNSILVDGQFYADYCSYSSNVAVDENSDDATAAKLSILDTMCYKVNETIPVDSDDWNVSIKTSMAMISKAKGSNVFVFRLASIPSIRARNINVASSTYTIDWLTNGYIQTDGIIAQDAEITEEAYESSNVATIKALYDSSLKTAGSTLELHLEAPIGIAAAKQKVNDFMEISGANCVYEGEDAFLTREEGVELAKYLIRKLAGIKLGIQV